MTANMYYAAALIQTGYAVQSLLFEHIHLPLESGILPLLSGLKIVLDLLKDPRPTKAAASYHDSIHSVSVKTLLGTLRCSDIAVAYDRDLHPGILLDLTYKRPVCLPGVHLCTGTAVYGQGLDSAILQLLGQFDNYLALIIPSQTGLDCNGNLYRIHHRTGNLQHLGYVLQHTGAAALACHLLDRTAKVQVQYIRPGSLNHLGGTYHSLRILTVNLDSHRALLITDGQFLHGTVNLTYQGIARHKLGIDHIGPEPLAEQAESGIRNILHRGQKHRLLSKIYISYLHPDKLEC